MVAAALKRIRINTTTIPSATTYEDAPTHSNKQCVGDMASLENVDANLHIEHVENVTLPTFVTPHFVILN